MGSRGMGVSKRALLATLGIGSGEGACRSSCGRLGAHGLRMGARGLLPARLPASVPSPPPPPRAPALAACCGGRPHERPTPSLGWTVLLACTALPCTHALLLLPISPPAVSDYVLKHAPCNVVLFKDRAA